jgi:hypothetical protein
MSENFLATLAGKRGLFKLPIGTKAIWLYLEKPIDVFKRVTIIEDIKDGLGGEWAIVKDDTGNIFRYASYGMLIKVYD